jgi:hypothetical protein
MLAKWLLVCNWIRVVLEQMYMKRQHTIECCLTADVCKVAITYLRQMFYSFFETIVRQHSKPWCLSHEVAWASPAPHHHLSTHLVRLSHFLESGPSIWRPIFIHGFKIVFATTLITDRHERTYVRTLI